MYVIIYMYMYHQVNRLTIRSWIKEISKIENILSIKVFSIKLIANLRWQKTLILFSFSILR